MGTAICTAPGMGYSTGSSMVTTLSCPPASSIWSARLVASVVDLPSPAVPPRKMPPLSDMRISEKTAASSAEKPRLSSVVPFSMRSR